MIIPPKRGFEVSEYENRLDNIQRLMHESRMDAILLTTQVDIEYYTGFKTQFFQSPTRPWYVLIPSSNKPKAIIPTIGESGMKGTWLDDIQTWTSPNPEDDGISLLLSTIKSLTKKYKCLGVPKSQESVLRMPLDDYENLVKSLDGIEIKDANKILRQVRLIKSTAEIDKIKHICQLTSQGFKDLGHLLKAGESEHENCKRFKQHLLSLGVDDTPYMVAGSGKDGYGSIIMGPGDKIIEEGDLFIVDTGSIFDSYFCDFDRNLAFGRIPDHTRKAHEVIFHATDAGFAAAHPGATTSEVWAAMWKELEEGGALGNSVGRMGHGLGMQLTEWPSVKPGDNAVLEPGVVLTLEPGMEFTPGKQLVHEENIVITEDGAQYLSHRASQKMPIAGI